ncbi:helix-turn-helix domain-containing protein [Labrys sp. KNU-23]|uniref:helix-turn-helix domain-containing protein n=1 Tax=Labrys sp. KNU-23 TaxID=2789216 RepID=UPI0011EF7513|nr:helix-turn-helix transcriptional regulator [Labrys sp. KNU-23]QEN85890.1 helix-turn-helix domain-containing protein [Labrys sp. KNU-23]
MSVRIKKERLPVAIGRELRFCREREGISAVDLARLAQISGGTLSKIERGTITASLTILQSLARILGVSLSALIRRTEERRGVVFVRHAEATGSSGFPIGKGVYNLNLGPVGSYDEFLHANPSLVVIQDEEYSCVSSQGAGHTLIFMLEGEMIYRYGSNNHSLESGDSLFFDAENWHGLVKSVKTPLKFLQINTYYK